MSCGSGPTAVAPTYTPEKIAQIQTYVGRIEANRIRLPDLERYIEKDNWVNVDNFTHGPLGQLRSELSRLSSQLLPADQSKAKALSEDILGHLQKLDEASANRDYSGAIAQYREFVGDFDALLSVVPEAARQQASAPAVKTPSVYDMTTSIPDPEEVRPEAEDMVRTPVLLDDERPAAEAS